MTNLSPVVGRIVLSDPAVIHGGLGPIKLELHADGTTTWKPIYPNQVVGRRTSRRTVRNTKMSTKTATQIPTSALDHMRGDARLYQLSEPLAGNVHVVVSGISNEWGTETYIFGADSNGEITSWGELEGSFKGSIDHVAALQEAGYEVTP